MAKVTITVPDIGGAEGAEVVEVLVAVGDVIELEQSLIVLESDKASMEIPASSAGKVVELKVATGDALSEGDAVLVVEVEGDAAGESEQATAAPAEETEASEASAESATEAPAPESSSAPAGEQEITVEIPDIGTDGDVELIELCVAVGDEVSEGDSLVVLESDKASMEVPAPQGGVITAWLVEGGATVKQGTAIAKMKVAGAAPAAAAVSEPAKSAPAEASPTSSPSAPVAAPAAATPASAPASQGGTAQSSEVYAGPAVRKLAREFGIDMTKVAGSGPKGRLLKEDLQKYVAEQLNKPQGGSGSGAGIPEVPDVDFSKFGSIEITDRSRIDKVTANNMSRNWLNVPHVTQFDDADITDLEDFRAGLKAEAERRGTKLTPMPFVIKAVAIALNRHPKLKSSLVEGGEKLVYKDYCHIGMAVDTPAGLVVPVIRDADKKSIWDISSEVIELAGLARDKKLKPDQMQGGVFSISSLGNIGGRGFTPIVNAPEVAILGVSKASVQPVWDGKAFAPRKMLPLSLSYDHRVINGGDAGRFLTELVEMIGDIRKILM